MFGCNCRNYYLQKWTLLFIKISVQNMNFKTDIIKNRYFGLFKQTAFMISFQCVSQPFYRILARTVRNRIFVHYIAVQQSISVSTFV